jgi:hypothetical protein
MMRITQIEAAASPTTTMFVPGDGFYSAGLPVPRPVPLNPPETCLPPPDTPEGTQFVLTAPGGVQGVTMLWQASIQVWSPLLNGHRMAFTPAYLASHGWSL